MSYLSRHLGDRNLRMRHHYLGGIATKPVARALEVKICFRGKRGSLWFLVFCFLFFAFSFMRVSQVLHVTVCLGYNPHLIKSKSPFRTSLIRSRCNYPLENITTHRHNATLINIKFVIKFSIILVLVTMNKSSISFISAK